MATNWLDREDGRLAYSDTGDGRLVVCVPGLGDLRQEYRFLEPKLLEAGFRVASFDLRGHGESSVGWRDLSAEAIGSDVLALIHHLGADHALVIGTSMAAAAAVWAAVEEPDAVCGIVVIGPFVRDVGSPMQQHLYRTLFRVLLTRPWGISFWMRYWASLFPSRQPPDFDAYSARLRQNLAEPGRLEALRGMMLGPSRREIEARLERIQVPALVLMGTKDRDFPDPAGEAAVVADIVGAEVEMIEGAGHYPHAEFPDRTARLILDFALASETGRVASGRRAPGGVLAPSGPTEAGVPG